MTPILLTPPSELPVVDHHRPRSEEDCTKRSLALAPLAVFIPPAAPSLSPNSASTPVSSTDDDDDDVLPPDVGVSLSSPHYDHDAPVRQWTGIPIRAIAPLPRRTPRVVTPANTTPHVCIASTPATLQQWAEPDADTDSGVPSDADADADSDDDEELLGDRVRIKDRHRHGTPAASRYCAYESITAAEGLAAWSFEELRVECYAQSRIARGTNPQPVNQPYLAIPPAFVPRIVARR